MKSDSALLVGLPPIIDSDVQTLILGSFPSPASLVAQQYYAHRQNQFWRLLGALLNEPLSELDYPARQNLLLAHHIGVWDVYKYCLRDGALDSAIQAAEPNDFSLLRQNAPQLKRVLFNGKTSGKFERGFRQQDYMTRVLPSTSPAYTLAFDLKLDQWRDAGLGSTAST